MTEDLPPNDPPRSRATHVVILDGTLSSLEPVCQTNAGRTYMLCKEMGAALSLYYEPGLQWSDWRSALHITTGKGINRQIKRAYGWLANRYQPGDRIFLFGYSRGAFAVRSLAGVIDLVGLLRRDQAVERNIQMAYRHYEGTGESAAAQAFRRAHCHEQVEIEMIGVWDTVKSLGINAPLLWRISERRHAFHTHDLSANVRHGFHALAHDETRVAYAPVMWICADDYPGRLEQVWFPGAHGDVGGQLGGFERARPLANIPLIWMLRRAAELGLPLPEGWETRHETDVHAPARGTWRGHGRFLMTRRRRKIGLDRSEALHPSVEARRGTPADFPQAAPSAPGS
ncbi:MAG: DUF2235 domain-containing protein [Pseudomonadota bacterium]